MFIEKIFSELKMFEMKTEHTAPLELKIYFGNKCYKHFIPKGIEELIMNN